MTQHILQQSDATPLRDKDILRVSFLESASSMLIKYRLVNEHIKVERLPVQQAREVWKHLRSQGFVHLI